MRNTYLNMLYDFASKDKNVVSLLADNGMIVYDDFRRDFPNRYYNFGISESNMVAAAAGMASCGKIPFVYTISAFIVYRAYEFLRNDVCFQNQNVKLVGIGTGLTYSTLGPSHHTTEDIGLLRSLPNLTVFSPATRAEMRWIMQKAYEIKGPVYIRLGNNNQEYYEDTAKFEIGKPSVVNEGNELTIMTTGPILNEVMEAERMLKAAGINAEVLSVHSLKPFDTKTVAKQILKTKKLVVVEEHNTVGGLYGAVSEAMARENVMVSNLSIGLDDQFAVDYGTINNVRKANGLDAKCIYRKILRFVEEDL